MTLYSKLVKEIYETKCDKIDIVGLFSMAGTVYVYVFANKYPMINTFARIEDIQTQRILHLISLPRLIFI